MSKIILVYFRLNILLFFTLYPLDKLSNVTMLTTERFASQSCLYNKGGSMTPFNMNDIKTKTYRDAYHRDGFTEIGFGIILFWFASIFDRGGFHPFFSLWVVYLPIILIFGRKLITQPRVGYVTIKNDTPPVILLATIIPLITPALCYIFFTKISPNPEFLTILYRFTPISVGISLCVGYLYAAKRANMPIYRIPAFLPLLSGIALAFTPFAKTKDAAMIFSIIFGLLFMIIGFIVMALFIKHNPKIKEQ